MKRVAIVIILLLVIILSFAFVWAKWQSLGPEDNYFNQRIRPRLDRVAALRSAFGLHDLGDARSDYLGGKYNNIFIEVDTMKDLAMQIEALELLTLRIQDVTGKPTSYVVSDRNILFQSAVGKKQIADIAAKYRGHYSGGDTAVIYLLYASVSADDAKTLGQTFGDSSIILYGKELEDFTAGNPDTLSAYEESTALHEFGHLIGLDHNDKPGCLMNESAEQAEVARESASDVLTNFCDYEKTSIGP